MSVYLCVYLWQVEDVSMPNDEGITALHNAICAGHLEIVKFLVEFGCDVNSPDSDGWSADWFCISLHYSGRIEYIFNTGIFLFENEESKNAFNYIKICFRNLD